MQKLDKRNMANINNLNKQGLQQKPEGRAIQRWHTRFYDVMEQRQQQQQQQQHRQQRQEIQ